MGSGDRGKTSLLSGERVAKCDPRVEACGELDELGSVLGALAAALGEDIGATREQIGSIQGDLLTLGARVAASQESPAARVLPALPAQRVEAIEAAIRVLESSLPPLQSFVIPGGHPTAAWAHVARAVCRRVERRVVSLEHPPETAIPYLNRLSSYLFALARWCNVHHGVAERPWRG
jgi:cob(I)alamin adenosyltransferase